MLKNKFRYRQYGLWDRYTDMHPESDQDFTIGINDPKKDWFFAHVDRFQSMLFISSSFINKQKTIIP